VLNRFAPDSVGVTPSTFAAAAAGVLLDPRLRARASSVLEAVIAAVPTAPASSPRPAAPASVDIPMERWFPGTGTGETPDLVVLSPGMRLRRAGHAPVIDLTM
jgi:hypothetical protein